MECLRCGHCCMAVGRGFWRHGDFENYPELAELAKQRLSEEGEILDDGLPCEMLQMTDGVAACKIELVYGKEAKPIICRDYPWLQCHQELRTYKGQGVCFQETG